ncbi:hypothetical protein G6O69_25630 [Pseudenhygromyxa sp. WMMC2535]|uniref:hypothetical protein n=1 Tax=Pseudenhygromyxa sp. WMMC2535 TaxID=2712867 RepID=UPI001595FB95|nr:hypothetical protein [Pseudenhygromyxa sp. WMMC2535]NVB41246.1 hypothetical protein [Pseudenhygromyxa sp. WMMC2535]
MIEDFGLHDEGAGTTALTALNTARRRLQHGRRRPACRGEEPRARVPVALDAAHRCGRRRHRCRGRAPYCGSGPIKPDQA